MLILTRRVRESVVIGEEMNILFRVLSIDRGQVRIGINAPKEVPVHREEIAKKIIRERLPLVIKEEDPVISELKIYEGALNNV